MSAAKKKAPRRLLVPAMPAHLTPTAAAVVEREEPYHKGTATWFRLRSEFITDPANPTAEELARKHGVSISAVQARASSEGWKDQREAWWAAAEMKLLEKIQDEYLKERVAEMRVLRRSFDALAECALPLVGKDGKVLRGEDGLPKFALPFKSQEQVIRSLLLVQERSMLLRGEAIMRTESAIRDRKAEDAETSGEDPTFAALAGRVNFSPQELRSLAREFLRKREAALASVNEESEETEVEDERGDESL